jgi:alkylation response protein AidB-like acyl-CoA dehydrogenase
VDLTLTDEQAMLADAAAAFVARECPPTRVRSIEATAGWHDRELWRALADLGWCGLALPAAYGGAGQGLLEVAVLAEQLGRGPLPSPLLDSTMLAAVPIAWAGSDAQRERLLPSLADGRSIGTLAVLEPGMPDAWSDVSVRGAPRLTGRKLLVPWAHVADVLLVATASGPYVVERERAGWRCERHDAFAGDPLCAVTLDGAPAEPLGPPARPAGPDATRQILAAAAAVQLAYAVGAAEACVGLAVRHASERVQFGRPIGSFQAVAHRCVDMRAEVDACRYLAYQAAWSLDHDPGGAPLAVTAALTYARGALRRVFLDAHQVHGASGFSTEHDLHLLTRRITAFTIGYASTPRHADALAGAMGLS